jgi:MoxR-like ATPase
MDYLNSFKKHKEDFLVTKINEALEWDFYNINLSSENNKNNVIYKENSDKLEKELLLAINE